MANLSKTTRDHEEIQRWAEARGGKPSHVKSTGSEDEVGILRIDFPGFSGEGSLEEISWDDFFEKFDAQGLALVYQEETADGDKSNFNKLVSGDSVDLDEDEKPAAKKTAARKSASRKVVPVKKSAAKKTAPAPKAVAKVPAKKVPAKKIPAKKVVAKTVPAKYVPAKKAVAKKAPAKKIPARKYPAKKAIAKKVVTRKAVKKTVKKSSKNFGSPSLAVTF